MPRYDVEITETLSRIIPIEAESPEEAERMVEIQYSNSEIILDYSDFLDWEITVLPNENSKEGESNG